MNVVENGARLRELRGDKPAREVASAIGISESALLMYEQGNRNPRDDTKEALARYYGRKIAEIFYPDDFTKCEALDE